MPTGAQLVALALTHQGIPYSASSDRFGPTHYDCSGMIHADLTQLGVDDSGASGWTSVTYQDWITRMGLASDLGTARVTPGMAVCEGHTSGPAGHIALTIGSNQVVETPSAEGHFVGVSPFDRNRYDFAGYFPGVAYPWGEKVTLGAAQGLATDTAQGCLKSCATGGCLVPLAGLALTLGEAAWLAHLAHLL